MNDIHMAVRAEGHTSGGAVFVFTLVNGIWEEAAISPITGVSSGDDFGVTISLDNDVMAIGAPYQGSSNEEGDVYIYSWSGSAWNADGTVTRPALGIWDDFGSSVSIFGNNLVAAAFGDDGALDEKSDSGAVYTYRNNGSSWILNVNVLRPSLIQTGSEFGKVVKVNTDTLVVSDPDYDSMGAVFTFKWNGTEWIETPSPLTPAELQNGDRFGDSLVLDDDNLYVGAWSDDNEGSDDEGIIYVYDWDNSSTNWAFNSTIKPSGLGDGDYFANPNSLAISGQTYDCGCIRG